MEFKHISVLLDETIDSLNVKADGTYVDGTLGGAGHAFCVCSKLGPEGRFIGIDQDKDAIKAATARLSQFGDKVTIIRNNYSNMKCELNNLGITGVDGILLDLGVSSYQLDDPSRGFSYKNPDAPLDMRMDDRQTLTAADIVNTYDEMSIYRIIRDYGEDKFAKNIAKLICIERAKKPLLTAGDLNNVISAAIPAKVQKNINGHPAKKTFQALRIEINRELEVLKETLNTMIDLLNDGGRLSVITFHSLEDRIVKTIFRDNESPCTCPPSFPVCVCGKKSKGRVITRKPIVPSEEEMEANSRSKSSKLRVFERHIE